jgi:hypothetical protein
MSTSTPPPTQGSPVEHPWSRIGEARGRPGRCDCVPVSESGFEARVSREGSLRARFHPVEERGQQPRKSSGRAPRPAPAGARARTSSTRSQSPRSCGRRGNCGWPDRPVEEPSRHASLMRSRRRRNAVPSHLGSAGCRRRPNRRVPTRRVAQELIGKPYRISSTTGRGLVTRSVEG